MLGHEFMRNAFLAGTPIALACGLVGYFVVMRGQVFAGDALSHVAFAGALAAAALGIDLRLGLFAATVLIALGMGGLGDRARADDVVIGSVFAWVLGLGALFLSIFTSDASGTTNGTAGVRVLFGSIFGLGLGEAGVAAVIGLVACGVVLLIARPLLFSSVDPVVAAARGVPVRAIGFGFLAILGVVAAEATQAVGALLLLGLLAAPAGAARLLTNRPYTGLALAGGLSVASVWVGLILSYNIGALPPSSAIIATAVTIFAAAAIKARLGAWPSLTAAGAEHHGHGRGPS
jgi:zinc/manganese transport system permease protein